MNSRYLLIVLVLSLIASVVTVAKDKDEEKILAPDSEIHLFDLSNKNGSYQLTNGQNISNNLGYDNQPFFTQRDQTILFVSMRDGKQTDVYEFDLESQKTKQLTSTPHSEYSPKTVGETENISFVSEGFNPYQSVWQLNRKTDKQSWLLNSKEPVGYYHLNNETGDVLFWSRYGWSVQYLNIKRNESRFVSGNAIPSSPQRIPNSGKFSFVHRQTNGEVWIKAFEPKDFSVSPIAPLDGTNFDYTWAPNGDILRFKDNKLMIWPANNKTYDWKKGLDLSGYFSGQVGRLAISRSGLKMAMVENK